MRVLKSYIVQMTINVTLRFFLNIVNITLYRDIKMYINCFANIILLNIFNRQTIQHTHTLIKIE